jgi:hypothetical protein
MEMGSKGGHAVQRSRVKEVHARFMHSCLIVPRRQRRVGWVHREKCGLACRKQGHGGTCTVHAYLRSCVLQAMQEGRCAVRWVEWQAGSRGRAKACMLHLRRNDCVLHDGAGYIRGRHDETGAWAG